ncbi:MAG TPA: LCP family protein [Propionicimonas sp.]|nr:LCP family protein [Propionicimonas sp.]HQD97236.1 LCP family protein [Propionicimonas sp.]
MTAAHESPSAPRRIADSEPLGGGGSARRVVDERTFGSAVGWTVLGTLIPGLGLWRAGRKVAGGILMGLFALVIGGGIALVLTQRKQLSNLALAPNVLEGVAVGLAVVAVGYVLLIGFTHLCLRPARPTTGQRLAGAGIVGLLSFVVAAPMAVGSTYAWTTANMVNNMFESEDPSSTQSPVDVQDPWADQDRINFLIIGGDSGNDRSSKLGDRTDTVIVASIDTHSGGTTLFTLPRNTARMPFPSDSPLAKYYPNGFYDGVNPANAEYFLNAMYRNVPGRVTDHSALGKTKDFGAEVMKASVGEALGLDIKYYVKVNMDGFKDFINAIGGVTLNVNYKIPIGGQTDAGIKPDGYIKVGPNQHMNGRLALWYARGRYGLTDYNRMERQRCVINAVVQQTTPLDVLQNYQSIAAAGEKTITTDVKRSLLPALVDLASKVQGTKLRSVVFTPETGFISANPDWDKVQSRVKKALKETEKAAQPTASATTTPNGTASASAASTEPTSSATTSATPSSSASSSSASSTAKAKSEDLEDVCGYHPEK